jgi:hypothetical protein
MKLSTSAAAQIAQVIQSMGRLRYMFVIPCYGWPFTNRLIDGQGTIAQGTIADIRPHAVPHEVFDAPPRLLKFAEGFVGGLLAGDHRFFSM